MSLLKPTTSTLISALPSWPMAENEIDAGGLSNWRGRHVPWVWTPEEFEEQTKMLVMNDCPQRDLLAWLVHGVDWDTNHKKPDLHRFEGSVEFLHAKGSYLRAWTEATLDRIDYDIARDCNTMSWHPVWKDTGFFNILDDFSWTREVRIEPRKISASRRVTSTLGALEMAQTTSDKSYRFSCAKVIGVNARFTGGADGIVNSRSINTLDLFFQRCLLTAGLAVQSVRPLYNLQKHVHAIWSQDRGEEEQIWWMEQSRGLSFAGVYSAHLLEQNIHPLWLIHSSRASELHVLKELNPDVFRSGISLELALGRSLESCPLPDFDDALGY